MICTRNFFGKIAFIFLTQYSENFILTYEFVHFITDSLYYSEKPNPYLQKPD